MSTTETEIKVDLDAADAETAKKAADKGKTPKNADAEAPLEVIEAKDAPKTPEKEVLTPDAGLEKLKKQLDAETQARIDAQRREREASEREVAARGEVQTTQLDLVKTAIDTVKQSQKTLRSEYATAMSAQDFDKVAEIQEAMGDNSARLLQLEQGKVALEKAPKPTVRPPADVVEEFVSRIGPEFPRSKEWLRANPEFVRDPQKNRQMIAAHELAIARGFKADTPEYFSDIENTLRIENPDRSANGAGTHIEVDVEDPTKDAAKPTAPRRAAPAAAPVSRSGKGAGPRANVVTLSAQEVEMAGNMGMTVEEYARQKVALKEEGRLN